MSIEALLSGARGDDESVELRSWKPRRLGENELLWIDAEAPDEGERQAIADALGLAGPSAASLARDVGMPDAEIHEDATEIRIVIPPDGAGDEPIPLRILVGAGWVVTSHEKPAPVLEERRKRVMDQRELGRLSAVQFLISVLDWQVDAFFRAADELEDEVDALDDAALRTERDILDRLVGMRRRVASVRRVLSPHRELYAELARPGFFAKLDPAEAEALDHLVGRLDRAAEAIGHAREMLIGTFDVHMTRTAQRTNDTMRVLTIASVVLLPAVVLAGVMGMNFRVWFFDDPNVFWVVLGAMVVMAMTIVGLARWRGWL